jgi:hypothetical protein
MRLLTAESAPLRFPSMQENARACALFSSFLQRRGNRRLDWLSAVISNSEATFRDGQIRRKLHRKSPAKGLAVRGESSNVCGTRRRSGLHEKHDFAEGKRSITGRVG